MTPRFAFLGTPAFAATILQGLLDANWIPVLVITEPAKPVGRDQNLTLSAVEILARSVNIPVATPISKDELGPLLQPLNLDLAIVAAYGKIIPENTLSIPRLGMVNVHASLLPLHRGASPIQAAILAGDTKTGVTYMAIEPSLDTGPIISQVPQLLDGSETAGTLTISLANLAAKTIASTLEQYVIEKHVPKPQDNKQATYTKKIKREDGEIKLQTITPEQLDRKLRAYTPWPGVYTLEFGTRLIIRRGHLNGSQFAIDELQWEGKKPVDGETFARAYPTILTQLPKTLTLTTPRN
jgi:methionyl-tRNA formyltransferase